MPLTDSLDKCAIFLAVLYFLSHYPPCWHFVNENVFLKCFHSYILSCFSDSSTDFVIFLIKLFWEKIFIWDFINNRRVGKRCGKKGRRDNHGLGMIGRRLWDFMRLWWGRFFTPFIATPAPAYGDTEPQSGSLAFHPPDKAQPGTAIPTASSYSKPDPPPGSTGSNGPPEIRTDHRSGGLGHAAMQPALPVSVQTHSWRLTTTRWPLRTPVRRGFTTSGCP